MIVRDFLGNSEVINEKNIVDSFVTGSVGMYNNEARTSERGL